MITGVVVFNPPRGLGEAREGRGGCRVQKVEGSGKGTELVPVREV